MDQELDKISQLPEALMNKILCFVPIWDAVRTSILSRKWRFKWTTIPNLVFDDEADIEIDESSELVKIIHRVLLLRSGPVEKFMISHKQFEATSDIDVWIRYLSKASITELILDVWKGPKYKVPSTLFDCEGLTSLRLCNVNLPVSPTFRGFKNLKILYLQAVGLEDRILCHNLISGSNALEDLSLINYSLHDFHFELPKLKRLCCRGSLIDFGFGIGFNSTFCSPSFHMEFHEGNTSWSDASKGYINLLKFFAPLYSIETLKLDGDVLKFLSAKDVPAMLAEPLLLLKNLFISGVNFKSVREVQVLLCLIRSAPNLQQVKLLAAEKWIHISDVDDSSGLEICDSPFTLAHLNSADLTGIGDSVLETGFIGILLSSSPALQKMTVKSAKYSKLYPSGSGENKLLKNMMHLQCVSTQAKLSFL